MSRRVLGLLTAVVLIAVPIVWSAVRGGDDGDGARRMTVVITPGRDAERAGPAPSGPPLTREEAERLAREAAAQEASK